MLEYYYKIRKLFRLPRYDPRRIKQTELLYPELRARDVIEKEDERMVRNATIVFLCIMLFAFIMIVASATENNVAEIERPNYGAPDASTQLVANIDGETYEVNVRAKSKELGAEEKEKIFEGARDEMMQKLLGKNESFSRIIWPLSLDTDCSYSEVEAYFQITDYSLIKYDGTLIFPDGFENGTHTVVKLLLKLGDEERIYDADLYLYRPTDEELGKAALLEEKIEDANENNSSSDKLILPDELDGSNVSYSKNKTSGILGIIMLGCIAIFIVFYLPKRNRKLAEANRKFELEIQYSEITSKLSILVGAGLSIRHSFEKIVSDYKSEKRATNERKAVYEEIDLALRVMDQGLMEDEAYAMLGERIGLPRYLRLMSLITANRKNGSSRLKDFLSNEARESFDNRLVLAKRQGEKISSKLLIPMIILFALIMLLLIIPAFMSF